ncbi:MAG: toluene monooxygenase system protein [Myxococcales bacterium]|jgi:toluene monooxygenase system protein D|nr:toluene monooxygenase system protein [Myxococcales bacterium]
MTNSDPSDRQGVGPVLQAGPVADAIINAIRRDNRDVSVIDRGAYLRVLCPDNCVVRRTTIEDNLRRPFVLPGDLEQVMSSFKGHFHVDEDQARWELTAAPFSKGEP